MCSVLASSGVDITKSMDEWRQLSQKYEVAEEEIGLIDFNRLGVCLDGHEVKTSFRTRFNGSILYDNDWSWFALPVRDRVDSKFHIHDGHVYFDDALIGDVDTPVLDTCDTSYQRGKRLLNLNSRSRSACYGCKACVHNDKSLYDDTVIKDGGSLKTYEEIEGFLCEKARAGLGISQLDQIAVVTGLFTDEVEAIQHMKYVHKAAKKFGFHGELMYFGCQIVSRPALEAFAELGNTALVFAIDNFTQRQKNLSRVKSSLSLGTICGAMVTARALGIQTTFAYIAGVDPVHIAREYFEYFGPVCTRFPVINVFQIQTKLQSHALVYEAKHLDYYVAMRKMVEQVFEEGNLRPRRWENYRPLWYRTFAGQDLNSQPYGGE